MSAMPYYPRKITRGRGGGRYPKLSYPVLRELDKYDVRRGRFLVTPMKKLEAMFGLNKGTIMAAWRRRGAYANCPRAKR
jgi:hypothetical protein